MYSQANVPPCPKTEINPEEKDRKQHKHLAHHVCPTGHCVCVNAPTTIQLSNHKYLGCSRSTRNSRARTHTHTHTHTHTQTSTTRRSSLCAREQTGVVGGTDWLSYVMHAINVWPQASKQTEERTI